jgi:hypothetical protein
LDLCLARHLKKMAVYCGFDPERVKLNLVQVRAQVRSESSLNTQAKVMLFVGRLDSNMDETLN